jgi:SNF2 family DNA or RNA helicase
MLKLFKQEKSFLTRAKENRSFKYMLLYDDNGAYIEVWDSKNRVINTIDYRVYNGCDREILRLLQNANQEEFFEISWEHDNSHLYLFKHPKVLELLKNSDKFYYHDSLLVFDTTMAEVVLKAVVSDNKLDMSLQVLDVKEFQFITSTIIMIENRLFEVPDVGEHFRKLPSFNTQITDDKLEEYLTILVTYLENIKIEYNSYKVIENPESQIVKPAIIFEKVTAQNELVMRTSATIGQLSADFFNSFNITKVVRVNSIEQNILILECDFTDVFEMYDTIFKNLNSLKRSLKDVSFTEEDGLFVLDEKLSGEFISNNLHALLSRCELFGSEKLQSYRYTTTAPQLSVNFKDKIDYLDSKDVSVTIAGEKFDLFEMIALYKKHAYIPLTSGDKSIVEKSYIAKLERIFKKEKDNTVKVSFFDLPEVEGLIAQKSQKVFKDSKKFYEGFNTLTTSKSRLPKLEGVTHRDYQKEGVRWLKYLYDNSFGGCLADDMGLGKTLQAISLLSYIYPKCENPTLIIMPKSLLSNWQNELTRFNSKLSYYCYYANQRDSSCFHNYNIILTTYALVRNDIQVLQEIAFDTIILDESQQIKNVDSKISKAVMLLNAKHRFALSGTPIENSLFELYSLFRFINPGLFSSLAHFKRDYATPIQGDANEEIAKVLKAKISPFLLRRLKSDVLKELPSKQEQVIYVDMDEAHKRFYNQKRDYYRQILQEQIAVNGIDKSKFVILQAFNDLRQIASAPEVKSDNSVASSKVESLFEMLEDIVANNHKVLIFANFLGSLDLIASKADEMGYEHLMMTGSTKDREKIVQKFQNEDKYKLFLMTLKVGGVGLNLTQADYVFIFDPWWNKAAENQAVDRAHRMGQQNTVFSYKMITKDTIEEKILELQSQKQDMTEMIISGEEGGLKELTSTDLEFILG